MSAVQDAPSPRYRVIQLVWDKRRGYRNESVDGFDDLVTHHPNSNRDARIEHGVVVGGQPGRRLAVVGGEFQEVEVARPGRDFGLGRDQVLLKKDFILEDSRLPAGPASRAVDVPSPASGVVGTVNARSGLVDILDRPGGQVIVRVRHLSPIHVRAGDPVDYGQALGVQGRQASDAIHVHMEVDTRHFRQYENYVGDLVSGRLAIDQGRRTAGIAARPVVDDGTVRVGGTSDVVATAQRALSAAGFVDANGQALADDGVYRLSMQPAVLDYQRSEGLPQTGDLDGATLQRLAPRVLPPAVRADDNVEPRTTFDFTQVSAADQPLHQQAQAAVRRLDISLGRDPDGYGERLAASAAWLAWSHGLSRIDHVLLGQGSQALDAGSLFVVQGALDDPGHLRARMPVADALARPADASIAQVQRLGADAHVQAPVHQEEPAAPLRPRFG